MVLYPCLASPHRVASNPASVPVFCAVLATRRPRRSLLAARLPADCVVRHLCTRRLCRSPVAAHPPADRVAHRSPLAARCSPPACPLPACPLTPSLALPTRSPCRSAVAAARPPTDPVARRSPPDCPLTVSLATRPPAATVVFVRSRGGRMRKEISQVFGLPLLIAGERYSPEGAGCRFYGNSGLRPRLPACKEAYDDYDAGHMPCQLGE
jgi:hypothetical protein